MLFRVRLAAGRVGREVRQRVTISDHSPVHVGRGTVSIGGFAEWLSIPAATLRLALTCNGMTTTTEMAAAPDCRERWIAPLRRSRNFGRHASNQFTNYVQEFLNLKWLWKHGYRSSAEPLEVGVVPHSPVTH